MNFCSSVKELMQRKRLHEEKDIWFGLAFPVAERRPIKPNRKATKSCAKFDTEDGGVVMSTLKDVNETLAMISEAARRASSKADAEYAVSIIGQWLDQLEREVEDLEDEEE